MKQMTNDQIPAPDEDPTVGRLLKLGLVCVICTGIAAGLALVIQSFLS